MSRTLLPALCTLAFVALAHSSPLPQKEGQFFTNEAIRQAQNTQLIPQGAEIQKVQEGIELAAFESIPGYVTEHLRSSGKRNGKFLTAIEYPLESPSTNFPSNGEFGHSDAMSTNADGEFSMQRMVIHAKNSKNYYLHSVAFENRTRAFENMRSDKQTTAYPILPILDKVVSIPANSLKMMVTNGNEDPALTTQHFGISEPNKSSAKDSKRQRRDQSQIFEMVSTVSRSPKQQLLENSGPNKSPANDIKGQQRDQNQIFEIISRPFSSFLMAKDWEISRKLWVPYSRVARQAVAGAISSIFFSFIFSIMRYFIRLILSYMFSFVGNIFTSGRPTT